MGAGRGRAAARVQGLRPAGRRRARPARAALRVGAELREPRRLPPRRADRRSSTRSAARTAGTGRTSASWSSPSTPTRSTGSTRVLTPARATRDVLAVIQGSTPPEDREYIRAQFTDGPGQGTGARAAGHRRRRRGHRPADPLPPAGELRHPVQPVAAGAAHRPDRPLRADPTSRRSSTSSRTDDSSTYAADTEFMARIARKVANVAQDLGSVNQVIGEEIQAALRRAQARRSARRRASTRTR